MKRKPHISATKPSLLEKLRAEDGNIAVLAAGLLSFFTATTAISVDAGSLHYRQKDLQRLADAVALAATYDPDRGQEIALNLIEAHGRDAEILKSVTFGGYDPLSTTGNVFAAEDGTGAVQIILEDDVDMPFLGLISEISNVGISARSVAANVPEAAFATRTGLLDWGITNSLLRSLNSNHADLTDEQFEALANQRMNILNVLDVIADITGSTAENYDELLGETVLMTDVLEAVAVVLNADPGADSTAVAAADKLAKIGGSPDMLVPLDRYVDLATIGARPVGEGIRQTDATRGFRALDIVTNAVSVAGQGRLIEIGHGLTIPGALQIDVFAMLEDGSLSGGSPGGAALAVGPEGTTIHPVSGKVLLDILVLGGNGGVLNSASIRIPLYVELGSADVTLTGISCGYNPIEDTVLTFATGASLGRAYIADIVPEDLIDGNDISEAGAVEIATIGPVSVDGYAELDILGSGTQNITFTMPDVIAGNSTFVGNEETIGSLFSSIVDNLYLEIEGDDGKGKGKKGLVGGLTEPLLEMALVDLLGSVATTVDPFVAALLRSLGLRAGYLELGPTDVRCGTPVIVS